MLEHIAAGDASEAEALLDRHLAEAEERLVARLEEPADEASRKV